MDFITRECMFLVFCLSLGAFGSVIEPFIQNTVVVAGPRKATFTCESSALSSEYMVWIRWPVGAPQLRIIKNAKLDGDPDFDVEAEPNSKRSHMTVRISNVSTAGVYWCQEANKIYAQLIVLITEESACNINPKPYNAQSCDEISELVCTLKYAANDSYVVADMKWSIDGSSESLNSSMETSTSANITTATSTLKLAAPEKYTSMSNYKCNTTFGLTDNLPSGFATNKPSYTSVCSPNADSCELLNEGGTSTEKLNGETNEKPNGKPTEKQNGKTTKRTVGKPTEKSGENSDGKGGGLSVGLSKRNIFLKCVVGIAGFLLIGRGTGV